MKSNSCGCDLDFCFNWLCVLPFSVMIVIVREMNLCDFEMVGCVLRFW
jgi:hypothetical protein